MPPLDREDRAALTKRQVATRERLFTKVRRRRARQQAKPKTEPRSTSAVTPASYPTRVTRTPAKRSEFAERLHRRARRQAGQSAQPPPKASVHERGERDFPRARPIDRARDTPGRDAREARKRKQTPEEYLRDVRAAGIGSDPGWYGRVAKDLVDVAVNTPGGLYQLGKAGALDVSDIAHGRVGRRQGRRPFERTTDIGEAIGRQYAADYRHPIRYLQKHPGFVGLDALAVISGGAGATTRVSAAARAAKEASRAGRSSLAAALTRPGHEGGSLLSRPLPRERTHVYEGVEIPGRYSRNPAVEAVQRAADKRRLGRAGHRVERGEAEKVSTIGTGKAARLLRERRNITDAAERAKILRLENAGRRLTDPQNLALRVVAEGLPLDDVLAAHKEFLSVSRGKARQRLAARIRELEAARPYLNEAGTELAESFKAPRRTTGRRGAKSDELAETYRLAEEVSQGRTARAIELNLLDEAKAIGRVDAPGRVMRGAETHVDEAERARLVSLERQIEKGLRPIIDREYPAAARQREQAMRNVLPHTRGKRAAAALEREIEMSGVEGRSSSVLANAYEQVEARIVEMASKPDADPMVHKVAALIEERDALKARVMDPERVFGDQPVVEDFAGGRFRVAERPESRRALSREARQFRGGVPRKPGTLTHGYTGGLRRSGNVAADTVRAVTEDALEFQRYESVERLRGSVVEMGRRARPEDTRLETWVPVRTRTLSRKEQAQLREALARLDSADIAPDELARAESALDSWIEGAFPEREFATTPVGDSVKGVVWVPRKLLDGLAGSAQGRVGGGAVRAYDTIAEAVKGIILYGKPGYFAPNAAGGVVMNVMQQGFLAPRNWTRSTKLPKDVSTAAKEVMGAGFARSFMEGTPGAAGAVHAGTSWAARQWSKVVDTPFRLSAFLYEARRAGYKSDVDLRRLLFEDDPKLAEITQRARDAIVDYERMGPFEKSVVRRVLFVYPWVKGSSWWAAQTVRDRPMQVAALGALGREGEERSGLGPLPSWARGSFKVGERDGTPYLVNPQSVNPFGTPGQVLATGAGVLGLGGTPASVDRLGGMLNPVLEAGIVGATGRDPFTGRELEGSALGAAAGNLTEGLPQVLLAERLRDADEAKDSDRVYPYDELGAVGQFVGGSSTPRPYNPEALEKAALREEREDLSSPERARLRIRDEARAVMAGLRANAPEELADPEVRQEIRRAYSRKQAVDVARSEVRADTDSGEPYYREALKREIGLLRSWGEADEEDLQAVLQIVTTGSLDEVKAVREEVHGVFDELYLAPLREVKEAAGVSG